MSDNTQLNPGVGPEQARSLERTANIKTQVVALDMGGAAGPEKLLGDANPMPVQGEFYPATQPVSLAAAPLPAGASTEATLAALKAAIDALSAKITACNTGAVTLDAGTLAALETITVANPTPQGLTDAQLRASALAVTVSNPTAQGLTDAQLRATAVPVALASVAVSNLPSTQAISGTVAISNFPAGGTGLTDTELRATAVPVVDSNAVQDATVQALNTLTDTMVYLLSAMLEKMPRVTGNDQCAVSVEGGAVGINGTPAVNLTNFSIGGKQASHMPDAISQLGALHLYQQITVS